MVLDIAAVRSEIGRRMEVLGHDDGSLGPLLIRLAWHCAGTFDATEGSGGTNGCTMRFSAEQGDPENNGLGKAREMMEPVKERFPELSYADLYALAGTVAIEYMGGPAIEFAYGRKDFTPEEAHERYGELKCPFGDGVHNPNSSRLPSADLGPDKNASKNAPVWEREAPTINAIRGTFSRMGFNDRETVCLIVLGHQFGRCHPEVSGYRHAWYGFDPTHWNVYESGLGYLSLYSDQASLNLKPRTTEAGKRQWEAMFMGYMFMMLPTDMALKWDKNYYEHIQYYDRNRRVFRNDAAKVWKKLMELGCDGILTPEN
mmetsp:Transcript_17750/g.32720  ORF Transcript_17750/g.32720 Transcript_17750/m.32720 type:complete len:315 (-) Transcript_17750:99-1043(-)